MAQINPSSPIQNLSGKFSLNDKIIFRTRNGRTHAYVMHNPYKGELAESRKAAINLFAEASRLCSQEMQDPDRLAYWQEEYKKHLKRTKNLSLTSQNSRSSYSRTKRYSTLRGFILAPISQQLKSQLYLPNP